MTRDHLGILILALGCLFAVLAVWADFFIVAAIVGVLALAAAVLWKLEIGIGLFAFAVILDSFLRKAGSIGGLWDEGLFILIIAALVWRLVKEKRNTFNPTGLWWAVAGFAVVAVVSGLLSGLPYGHIITAIRSVLQAVILFVVIVNAGFDRKTILHITSLLIICAAVVAGYALLQRASGVFTPQGWLDVHEATLVTRATSFLGSPNATAGFLALIIPISIGMTMKVKRFWSKAFWLVITVVIILGLYATLNRAAWIGLTGGLVVFAIASGKRWWIGALLAAVVAAILFLPDLRMRFAGIFTEDFAWRDLQYGRSFRWATAIDIFGQHPILGIGPGGFGGAVAYGIQAFGGLYVDNYYLLILSNYGLVGFGFFTFILISNIREAFKGLKKALIDDRLLVAGFIGGMVAFMIHLLAENLWQITPLIVSFWLVAGLAASFAYRPGEGIKCKSEN
ncbi:MAG TPA: O-antigen ligase family protein [Caldisericia bacterium]|nr:O-antigen ligase family protein [Caldisericia bacterium]HPF49150.1 O-antigen ligase family protein [Caldisericia bacterium]HPI82986.1 O-antigen ligase family protein [Caldisericia bacterium]HPQ92213.1 O-antigen ligase family protein [Caldisericia bacterium]HRV74689.1 O-antigen ligase family protein [Caldisericia bacterium]